VEVRAAAGAHPVCACPGAPRLSQGGPGGERLRAPWGRGRRGRGQLRGLPWDLDIPT